MTARASQKRQPEAPAPQPNPPAPRYVIDLGWYEARGRSLTTLLVQRMCLKHQRRWGNASPDRSPEEAIAAVKGCCSQQDGFLAPSLSLAEAVFRVLLTEGNQPASAEEIAQRLEAWNTGQERVRDVSAPTIARILGHDQFYGFRRVEQSAGVSG